MPIQPYSPVARVIGSPLRWLLSGFLVLLLLTVAVPLWDIQQQRQQQDETALANQQQQTELQQKQQIIALLKQKIAEQNRTLDPQLAAQISPLNQRLQSAVKAQSGLTVRKQNWQFAALPQLQLELEGQFLAIQRFLRQLEPHFSELALLKLELSHADNQAQTVARLTLQLTIEVKPADEKEK